jgi:hypothetical protein
VLERAAKLAADWRCPITLDPASPAGAFVPLLAERGVDVDEITTRELTQACGALVDAVLNGQLRFVAEPGLNAAVAAARSRRVADAWAWSRSGSNVDITPLVAATLALCRVPATRKPTVYVSVD